MFGEQLLFFWLEIKLQRFNYAVGYFVFDGKAVRQRRCDRLSSNFMMRASIDQGIVDSYHIARAT